MTVDPLVPGSMRWEALCRRCGRCCHEKVELEGQVYLTPIPCQFLDPGSRLCRVYEQRCERMPGCVALTPEIIALGVLPPQCPYRQQAADLASPRSWEELPEQVRLQVQRQHRK